MSLFGGAKVYLIANILNAAIPFLLLPILTRYLSPSEYGQIAMFQTLLAGIGTFIGLNAVGSANRKYYDADIGVNSLREYNGSCFQILMVSTIASSILILLFMKPLSNYLAIPSSWLLAAIFISVCTFSLSMRLGQWQIRCQAKLFGILQVSNSFVNMLLSLLLVVALKQGAEGRIDAQVASGGILAVFALFLLYKDKLLKILVWRPLYIKEILAFGIPLIPHNIGFFLISTVDRFVINEQLGLAEAGIYMVAMQLSLALSILFDSINKAYVPWLFERLRVNNEEDKNKIVRYTYLYFLIVLLLAGLAFIISPQVITYVAGDEYSAAGDIIGWLCLGQVFGGMYLMVTNYIFYAKKTGKLALVTIVTGAINVLLLFEFVSEFGMLGAAFSFSIAKFIQFILTWILANRCVPMPWRRAF